MSSNLLEHYKAANTTLDLSYKNEKLKQDKALKTASLLSKTQSGKDVMGDVALSQANAMSGQPKNVWGGVAEGLLRAFGMVLKGKSAEEKKKTIQNAMEVYDWLDQASAYSQKMVQDINQRKEAYAGLPSQGQALSSIENGTLEQTIKAMLKENGVNPDNVSFESDYSNVFIEGQDGSIQKHPIQHFFNKEDSPKYAFQNNLTRINLAKSENKQIQGLTNENEQYKALFKGMGLPENNATMLATSAQQGAALEKQKIANETKNADAYSENVKNTWDPQSHFNREAGKVQGSEGNKRALKLQEANAELEDVKYDLDYLSDLLESGQVITGDTLKAKGARIWAGLSGNQAMADTELFDATAKSLLKFANNNASFGNANTKEFDFLRAPVPDSEKTRSATIRLIRRFQDKLQKIMARNERVIAQYENFNPYSPPNVSPPEKTSDNGNGVNVTPPPKQPQVTQTPLNNSVAPSVQTVMMKKKGPDGSFQTQVVPINIVEKFLNAGWVQDE